MLGRNKVIKGLECCMDILHAGPGWSQGCIQCPYAAVVDVGRYPCMRLLANDALELIKAQEPRVLTLEEVKAFDWDYCYLEEERLPGKEYRSVCGDYVLTCITWPCVTSMRIQHGDESYGKKWRCWSAKPTDEQREATPWID